MNEPLVSIIIPAYNAEKLIARTLGTIIAQDYENLEIIVVNDASADSTLSTAQGVLQSGGRTFRIIDHARRRGVSAARNTGLADARGKYVWFCDDDDLAERNLVSLLCAKSEACEADIVFCGMRHFWEDEGRYESETLVVPEGMPVLDAWSERRILFWSVWNFIFRRDFLVRNGLHFTEGCTLGEDTEFVMKALVLTDRVSFVKDELYTYVHHSGQTSRAHREDWMFRAMTASRLRLGRFIVRRTNSRKVRQYVLSCYLPDMLVTQCTAYAKSDDRKHYARLVRSLRHKKIRELLLSSVKFVLKVPELFFKAVMLLYAPGLYYVLRRKK